MTSYGFAKEKVEIELNISKEFQSIFDLAYTLIDLQALITSINYVTYEKRGYKTLPVTSRTFAAKYRDELMLKAFEQGSFRSNLTSSLIEGLILLFADKYYDSIKAAAPPTPPTVININIENNIHNDNRLTTNVRHENIQNIENDVYTDNSRTFSVQCQDETLQQRMNEIIDRTRVIPGDPETSTQNLIEEINSSEILGNHHIPTDEQGVKAIAASVERFTKSIE